VQIVRFRVDGKTRYGAIDGAGVIEYTGTPWSLFRRGRRRYPLRQVVLLSPMPPRCNHLECEATLGVVMKRRCRNVPAARAREYVLGYAALNDVTARDVQARDGDWTRAKAFDTFCPLVPCSTKELVLGMEAVIARVSEILTLLPGDVVATGTTGASGRVEPGDRVEIRVEGVGGLRNAIVRL